MTEGYQHLPVSVAGEEHEAPRTMSGIRKVVSKWQDPTPKQFTDANVIEKLLFNNNSNNDSTFVE